MSNPQFATAQAATIDQTVSISGPFTTFNTPISVQPATSFNRFNPNLGTLTGVAYVLTNGFGNFGVGGTFTLSPTTGSGTGSLQVSGSVTDPNGAGPGFSFGQSSAFVFPGNSGYTISYGFGGPQGTYSAGPINNYKGTASFKPTATFNPHTITAAGHTVSPSSMESHLTLTLRYTYTPSCVVAPKNLVLWLPFDEAAGPTARNSVGGNNGTHIGGPTVVNQYVANGLCFNGTSAYVSVPSYPALNRGTGDLTVDAWVTAPFPPNSGVMVILDKRIETGSTTVGYHLYTFQGRLGFQLADGQETNYDSGTVVPNDGQWHHVAVTVCRNSVTGGRFYIDGAPVGVPFNTSLRNGSLSNSNPFTVGSRSSDVSGLWPGCIDEVEVFCRCLTGAEIASIYAPRTLGKCKSVCQVPLLEPFCVTDSAVTVLASICNRAGVAQTYNYSFQGLPVQPGCNIAGPTSFTPSSGTITVQPGQCAPIAVTIGRPAGMTAINKIGCYNMNVTSVGTGETFSCKGSVIDRRDLCCVFPGSGVITGTLNETLVIPVSVTNTSGGPLTLPYQFFWLEEVIVDQDVVAVVDLETGRLNGLPPGTPVTGTLSLANGESTIINLTAEFILDDPLGSYSILMQADTDGDGTFEPLASTALQSVILPNLELLSAVSRKTHGAAGTFDIPLPLTGNPGIEGRRGSPTGTHTLVFTFNNQINSDNGMFTGTASVVPGAGGTASISGVPTVSGSQLTVNLAGVSDVQTLTVTLSGVTDIAGQVLGASSVSMGVLFGDANGSRVVDSTDILQVRARSGLIADPSNFRRDVNSSGVIDSTDILQTRSRSGTALP